MEEIKNDKIIVTTEILLSDYITQKKQELDGLSQELSRLSFEMNNNKQKQTEILSNLEVLLQKSREVNL